MIIKRQSFTQEIWAATLSIAFLGPGLLTFWLAKVVVHADGGVALDILVFIPIVVYLVCSGRLTEIRAGAFEASFAELRDELDDVRFVLSMLLGPAEQKHLVNLASGDTKDYVGRASLKTELRKLRDLRLTAGVGIGRIPDGRQFDLKEIVTLTDLGKRCIERFWGIVRDSSIPWWKGYHPPTGLIGTR